MYAPHYEAAAACMLFSFIHVYQSTGIVSPAFSMFNLIALLLLSLLYSMPHPLSTSYTCIPLAEPSPLSHL